VEAVRIVTRAEEEFRERKSVQGGGLSGTTRGEKRKFEDSKPSVAAMRVQEQYTSKEKADYNQK